MLGPAPADIPLCDTASTDRERMIMCMKSLVQPLRCVDETNRYCGSADAALNTEMR